VGANFFFPGAIGNFGEKSIFPFRGADRTIFIRKENTTVGGGGGRGAKGGPRREKKGFGRPGLDSGITGRATWLFFRARRVTETNFSARAEKKFFFQGSWDRKTKKLKSIWRRGLSIGAGFSHWGGGPPRFALSSFADCTRGKKNEIPPKGGENPGGAPWRLFGGKGVKFETN